mmetsp:Transcript_40462/g.72725  ORF Transcript_40462/g.72725 Transcript_40462/m.72725 type:complete len:414 (-) Transcript_40462:397-1638(-)
MATYTEFPIHGVMGSAIMAVLQALAMALLGVILTRQGIIDMPTKKIMSNLSMKVLIPCLLFSNLLACPQGGPDQDPALCPDFWAVLSSAYPFLILPFIWVGTGLLLGWLSARLFGPKDLRGLVMSACAFGNSTGLPIVLFEAISGAGVASKDIDPQILSRLLLSMLSVYQIIYPMLQWSLGQWLLTPKSELKATEDDPESQSDSNDEQENQAKCNASCLWELAGAIFTPPVVAILVATVIGAIHPLRGLLIDLGDYTNDAIFSWFFSAIAKVGKAAVPVNMLVLGAGLANIPKLSEIHWPTTIAVVVVKMFIYPAIAFGFVAFMLHFGIVAWMIPYAHQRESMVIVACLLAATPTANNLAVMAELAGGPRSKQALSGMIFIMYCVAPFSLTAWITAVASLSKSADCGAGHSCR